MNQTTTIQESEASREAFAQMMWGSVIVGFFVVQFIMWGIALFITHNDPSYKVIANYEQRAVNWDAHRQEVLASEQLRWTADIRVSEEATLEGFRKVTVVITDRDQQPVPVDQVSLSLFHRARAAEQQDLVLESLSPTVWQGTAKMKRSGAWQFAGTADKGDQHFLIDQRQVLTLSKP